MLAGFKTTGGEGGIRTLGTGVSPYNGLANRRLQPLGHLSGDLFHSLSRWLIALTVAWDCSQFAQPN